MENQLVQIATSQGIWAVLSVFLIFYILKAQEKIEENYHLYSSNSSKNKNYLFL